MSTDYEFRCIACNDSFGRDNWRTPEQLDQLLPLAPHLAAIGVGSKGIWLCGWDEGCISSLCEFFAGHIGHDVRVFDEYGRDWSRRAEVCECGHSYERHYNYDGLRESCSQRADDPKHCDPHPFKRVR